jgi:hypothetical protein
MAYKDPKDPRIGLVQKRYRDKHRERRRREDTERHRAGRAVLAAQRAAFLAEHPELIRKRQSPEVEVAKRAACHKRWASRQYEYLRDYHLKTTFGIGIADFNRLLASQNGVCAICLCPETVRRHGKAIPLHVDHDHATGRVRGLLCMRCNNGVGLLGEDPTRLRMAAQYLESSRSS